MSEVDVDGQVLATYNDVLWSEHLSIDSEGRVLVADYRDRILLLSSQLELDHVLIGKTNSQGKLRLPIRLYYNERTSQLYIAHRRREKSNSTRIISLFNVRWIDWLSHSLLQSASATSVRQFNVLSNYLWKHTTAWHVLFTSQTDHTLVSPVL